MHRSNFVRPVNQKKVQPITAPLELVLYSTPTVAKNEHADSFEILDGNQKMAAIINVRRRHPNKFQIIPCILHYWLNYPTRYLVALKSTDENKEPV